MPFTAKAGFWCLNHPMFQTLPAPDIIRPRLRFPGLTAVELGKLVCAMRCVQPNGGEGIGAAASERREIKARKDGARQVRETGAQPDLTATGPARGFP